MMRCRLSPRLPNRHLTARVALVGLALTVSVAGAQGNPKKPAKPSGAVGRATTPRVDSAAAVRRFIQQFYDWYTPFVAAGPKYPAWFRILTYSERYLAEPLASALRADSTEQGVNLDSREVIDFDPFLESQDPCPLYEATDVHSDRHDYRVTVRPICPNPISQGWQTSKPVVSVVAEGGQWKIANVYYKEKGDLMSMLCRFAMADLRVDRQPAKCL
ncbi:MAG TPA: DUF3828 domain-containing protein [Gemmatimonadaceae bacterium]|jgi:hypothetical protein|nr:DUF3828 domain-containing protein [Gemmatimonadaceae bacterium]